MNIGDTKYTIGADPELFVGRDGQFVSAHGLVRGTKDQPFKVEKGAVQVDGMALEFNIDPAESAEEFQDHLDTVQAQLRSMIGDLDFLTESSVTFDKEFMANIPYDNLVLGCEPDFNAYTRRPNPRPNEGELMRTAGGHVHVGGFFTSTPESLDQLTLAARVAKSLDETLGVYSLFWDQDDKRRSMYGQAGCFRPKEYGMEYRTLSNKWIFKPVLVKFVFDAVAEALTNLHEGVTDFLSDAQDIINTSDRSHSFFKKNQKVEFLRDSLGV